MAIQLSGSLAITGSLVATGQIVAQTLNVQQVTSSIVYSSGSNIFGNSVSNTQQFTGSLQVSGSNHYVLGNVGIDTTSPAYKLDVQGTGRFTGNLLVSVNQNNSSVINISNTTAGTAAQSTFQANSDTTSGYATFGKFSSLNSGYKIIAASNAFLYTDKGDIAILNDNASGAIKLAAGGSSSSQLTISSTGNLGLGVTPSAWVSGVGRTALQVGITSVSTNVANDSFYGTNYYDDGTNNRYINSDFSLIYAQQNGNHIWYNSPSGTAGNAISFTQAMTLNASGNLSIGNTNDTFKLDVTGQIRVNGSTNEQLIVDYTTASGGFTWQSFRINGANKYRFFGNTDNSFALYSDTAATQVLTIASTGAATFSSSVTAQGMTINGASDAVLSIVAPSATAYVSFRNVGGKLWGIGNSFAGTNTNFQIYNLTDNINALSFASSGAATFSANVSAPIFTSTGGRGTSFGFRLPDWQIYNTSSGNALAFSNYTTDFLYINSSGNVGIGTTSPSWKLDVRGTGMFNGDLQLDLGDLNATKTLFFNANSTTGGSYGNIKWYNVQWDGNTRGEIVVEGDGALANGRMVFKTGSSGSNATEKMRITSGGTVQPGANGTQDLGTSSLRWATVFTSDLSLSNGIGDYTIVEGEEKLYLYNNKNNKVYSFVLQEEDPKTATPKKS